MESGISCEHYVFHKKFAKNDMNGNDHDVFVRKEVGKFYVLKVSIFPF